jgi:hypothetical protein
MRRRIDDYLPSVDDVLGAGAGQPDIPYDQTQTGDEQMPQPQAPQAGAASATDQPAPIDQGTPGVLAGLGDQTATPDSGALSDQDLSQMVGDPDEAEAQQLAAMLQDPTVPPDQKQQIQAMLATAARRRLAGVTGAAM